jgi:hypothetical protein
MQSTHVQTLDVIGGVPPLKMRFSMLNHRYLISAFSTAGHPFRQELAAVSVLNSPKIVREFNVVEGYNLEPVCSVNEYPLGVLLHMPEINDGVERELSSISKYCYQTVVPRLVASVSSRFESSAVFFTDRSKGSSAGTKWCLHIGFVGNLYGLGPNRRSPPCMSSDSMSSLRALRTQKISHRTHSLVYEIKEASW